MALEKRAKMWLEPHSYKKPHSIRTSIFTAFLTFFSVQDAAKNKGKYG
jgi:hypothetical protein